MFESDEILNAVTSTTAQKHEPQFLLLFSYVVGKENPSEGEIDLSLFSSHEFIKRFT